MLTVIITFEFLDTELLVFVDYLQSGTVYDFSHVWVCLSVCMSVKW